MVAQAYQQDDAHEQSAAGHDARPRPTLALRRHTDRCFFEVEEVVREADGAVRGYVVDGILIDKDDVAETRRSPRPDCL